MQPFDVGGHRESLAAFYRKQHTPMPDLPRGTTVYFSVWSDRNCGPPLETEVRAVVMHANYEPTEEDRADDTIDYLRPGRRYLMVNVPQKGLRLIAAEEDLRTEPTFGLGPLTHIDHSGQHKQ